jgi:CRISPR-associated protein Cas2
MKIFLIAYDIFDKKRLSKVRKLVYSYALGGQKSALESLLSVTLLKSLVFELEQLTEDKDKINIIKVDEPILLGKAKDIHYTKNAVIIL